jgi:hypothetical protein
MALLKSLLRLFSSGGKASALYERAMAKAKADDWTGAIQDYTAVIDSDKTPSDVKAMAHFNRALAYAHEGLENAAHGDLKAALAIPDAPANIRSAAKEKLNRWEKRRSK